MIFSWIRHWRNDQGLSKSNKKLTAHAEVDVEMRERRTNEIHERAYMVITRNGLGDMFVVSMRPKEGK